MVERVSTSVTLAEILSQIWHHALLEWNALRHETASSQMSFARSGVLGRSHDLPSFPSAKGHGEYRGGLSSISSVSITKKYFKCCIVLTTSSYPNALNTSGNPFAGTLKRKSTAIVETHYPNLYRLLDGDRPVEIMVRQIIQRHLVTPHANLLG